MDSSKDHKFPADIDALRERLAELEETLYAIRTGQVDALVDGTDIYTLVSAETASNRFRGQVLQQISETVIAVDNDNLITYINEAAEKQYGRLATDVIGLPVTALFDYRWNNPGDEKVAHNAIKEHGHWRGENIHVHRNGQIMHVESVINVLRDEAGDRIGLLAVMRDITQHVKDREELSESARQKDHFLATLAHELRNPLAPLMNGMQLLEMDEPDDDPLVQTKAMMQRQLDQLVRLVDDLLDMSRISRGKLDLRKEDLDLTTVLATAVETSRPLIDRNRHELNVEVRDGKYGVHGDGTRLAQIISNLLNNAAKYTPPGGVINVELAREGDDAVITVSDNGIGIEHEQLEHIFDMFSQIDGSVLGAGGLGIGLNIAKRLAVMHGGTLSAHSAGNYRGSAFTFRMPVCSGAPRTKLEKNSRFEKSNATVRVLVVDDNRDVTATMTMVLKRYGQTVKSALSGEEALMLGAQFQPQLVLMDIGMPSMNGYEACKRMREEPWGEQAYIVALSGWGQEDDRSRSHDAGFDEHIVKPVDGQVLRQLLERVHITAALAGPGAPPVA